MRRTLMTCGIAAVAIAAATTGLAGAQAGPQTMRLVAVEQGCAGVDVGRHGDSLGDETFCRAMLHQAARSAPAGRAHWDCTYRGTEGRGDDCTASAALAGGTLQMAGVLSHRRAESTWAITGGTGTYAGARGTVAVRQLSAKRTAVTIALLP